MTMLMANPMDKQVNASASTKPVPVILGGENGALPIVRSLAKIGLRSIVASEHADDLTFKSRYCTEAVVLREFDPSTDQENVRILADLSQRLGVKPVLLWSSDREVLFLSRNQAELAQWYRFIMCEPSLTEQIVDKAKFSLLADAKDLPVPKTIFFYSREEILNRLGSLPLPCIIKPVYMKDWYTPYIKLRYGSYKHALHRLRTQEEVRDFVKDLPNIERGIVVQEFIEGRDEQICSFHGYFDEAAEPVAAFVGRKIRTSPPGFGGSAFIETMHDPEFLNLGIDICRRIGFKGVVKIDFKKHPVTDKYIILEFNPRFTLWNYLGAFAGLNIPAMWYNDLTGRKVQPSTAYEPGRRWVCVRADLRALPAYLKSREWTLWQWLRSYAAPKVYHTWAWDDPWPFAFVLPRFVARRRKKRELKRGAQVASAAV